MNSIRIIRASPGVPGALVPPAGAGVFSHMATAMQHGQATQTDRPEQPGPSG